MNSHLELARSFWDTARRLNADRKDRDRTAAPEAAGPLSRESQLALAGLGKIRDDCRRLVTRRATMSAGAAVIPIPGLDVGTDIAILLKLLPEINDRFGLSPAQIDGLDAETKRVVLMFVGSVGSAVIGRLVTRELVIRVLLKMGVRVTTKGIVKFVPLLGQALSASISFGAMKLLGNRHVDDCYEVARQTLLQQALPKPPTETRLDVVT